MSPNGEFTTSNELLEPHKSWGQKTKLMFAIDLVAKPFLVLFIIANMFFFVFRMMPGDPASIFISGNLAASRPDLAAAIRLFWGLDQPLLIQYGIFILHFFTLGFLRANSFTEGFRPMGEAIAARLPQTFLLTLIPFIIVCLVFVLLVWRRRNNLAAKSGWRRHLYEVLFSKWLWILLAIVTLWGSLQLGIMGILPLSGTVSVPAPEAPLAYFFDVLRHLIAPGAVVGLLCTAVATHYFYQKPGGAMPPLSHGLPRLLVWTVSIAIPVEMWYHWYGLGRYLFTAMMRQNYPALLAGGISLFLVFGLSALLLETILRWVLYRNPVELHGHQASLIEKRSLRRITTIIGLVLVFVFIGIAIAGSFVHTTAYWVYDAPLEFTLRGLLPLLIEGATIGFLATLIGGHLGLGAYFALRSERSWPVKYIPAFIVSIIVLVFSFQVLLPAIVFSDPYIGRGFINGAGLLLSVGAIRRISKSDLGKGHVFWTNWARSLLPFFIFYSLVGGLLVFTGGFMQFFHTHNLGWVIMGIRQGGFWISNPIVFLLPVAFLVLYILAFDLLWCGLRNYQ